MPCHCQLASSQLNSPQTAAFSGEVGGSVLSPLVSKDISFQFSQGSVQIEDIALRSGPRRLGAETGDVADTGNRSAQADLVGIMAEDIRATQVGATAQVNDGKAGNI